MESDENVFLINYLNHLDYNVFVHSIDHLELLNSNLNFYLKFSSKPNDGLVHILEQLFTGIVRRKDDLKFNHIEINFITIFCKLLSQFKMIAKISSLILGRDNLIELGLKIEIVHSLFVERLVDDSNSLIYIDFVFESLGDLFDEIQQSHHNQQTTKLVNSIIWILFDFIKSDLHVDQLIQDIGRFLNRISLKSREDDQLVDFSLDFIASLATFCANEIQLLDEQIKKSPEKKSVDKLKSIKLIQSTLKSGKIDEIVINSTVNVASTSIRKKARYISDQLKLLPLIAIEILETLEEKQLHLIQPFIDKKLNAPALRSKLNISSFETVLELIIQRMFEHDCRNVKLYAFNFIKNNSNQLVSEQFILGQVILTLQNNLIYDEHFINESMGCLSSISAEKILKSLLSKEAQLSSYGLYFIMKQVFSNSFKSDEKFSHQLDLFTVQKLLNLPNLIGERSIRASVQIYLVKVLTRNLGDDQFLLNILYGMNANEVKIQNVILDINQTIQLDAIDLNNNCQLVGLARYFAINCQMSEHLNQLIILLKQLRPTDHLDKFLLNFLSALNRVDVALWCALSETLDLFESFEILKLVCSKVNGGPFDEIVQLLISRFNSEIDIEKRLQYLGLLSEMNESQMISQLINDLFENSTVQLNIIDDAHWKLLNRYLSNKQEIDVDHVIRLLNHQPIESYELKLDFLSSLISKTSTEMNIHVIELLGNLLNAELTNNISIEKTFILQNLFLFDDLLFKSCLEIKKIFSYQPMFKLFIKRIAFPVGLFLSSNSLNFFKNSHNLDQLNSLFDKILESNALEIKSTLLDHINRLIYQDPLLVQNKLFSTLLIKNLTNGCLLDKKFKVLNDHLKKQISTDEMLSECLNFDLDLEFHKETRIKSIFTSLTLDLDTLTQLMNKMAEKEIQITDLKISNYPNSTIHRTQVKIWQFILVVTLKVLKSMNESNNVSARVEEMLKLIYDLTIKSIVKQSSTQPSVRLLQQIIIILLIKEDGCPKEFYEQFKSLLSIESTSDYLSDVSRNKQNEVNKIGYITSLLAIIYHLIKYKPELKHYPINYLITCNHYKTRLFSHLVLVENDVQIDLPINEIKKISAMPKSISGSNNIIKNFNLLRGDWFFSSFDCDSDINLHFIFHLLPKLTNLFEDDFIDLHLLSKHLNQTCIKLQNSQSKLADASHTDFSRPARNLEFEECSDNQKEIFQKKYIGPQLDLETNNRKCVGDLIICASLIDRPPNLGGLARTSEIFGVRKLIIPNSKVLKEKEFLNLSVTAEKWIDIEECFAWNLVSYLRDLKKNHNYTLIALEQSTESICLTDFEFPVKSLILLGNEKAGLPIELLSMMDHCVEIPQSGIIKSLNVHVSGALCVFEYFKQQNFKQPKNG